MHFRFMLDEEVRRQSVVKITNLDVYDKPIPGGLYDPVMGSLGDGSSCKSCGRSSYHCNEEVENSFSQLKLIEKGDIIGARKLRLRQDLQDKKERDLALQDDIINRENGHSGADIRSNPIRSGRSDVTQSGGCEDKASSELVMEHPHTRKLAKVLLSNIALRNAHMNNSEHLTIICRWMDLSSLLICCLIAKLPLNLHLCQSQKAIYRQPAMGYPPYFGLRLRHPQFLAHLDRNVAIREVDVTNLPGTHHGATMASVEIPSPKEAWSQQTSIIFSRKGLTKVLHIYNN
ncbi:hypothetical protein OROMI_003802 [Orobanche minor]